MYRPWGTLDWIVNKGPDTLWDMIGCLGTEERSLAAWSRLKHMSKLRNYRLLRISDRPSRHTSLARQRCEDRLRLFRFEGGNTDALQDFDLMDASYGAIETEIVDALGNCGGSLILDVSSMPKRFFFPILRLCLQSTDIDNLLVTYSVAGKYTSEKLAENCEEWFHLPFFSGTYTPSQARMLIVSVGFEGLGLQDQVDHSNPGKPVKLLFPFPSPPSSFRRAWEFVHRLQKHKASDVFELFRTDFRDVSDCFDRLLSITQNGTLKVELAPFGPKPISVGICLFAALTESEVFYTQPKVYHPDYSTGIASDQNGIPQICTYCIRLGGRDLYTLT